MEFAPSATVSLRVAYPDPGMRIVLSERQTMHARLFPAGHRWNVVSDDFSRRFKYRVEAWQAHLAWNIRLRQPLHVDLSVGYEFRREHEFADDSGLPLVSAVDDQWVLGIGFRLGAAVLPYTHGGHL